MKTYTVTNIRIAKQDLKKLKLVALERDESVSAILRGLIADALPAPQKRARKRDVLWSLPDLAVKTKDKKLSQRIDSVVYGK